MTSLPARLLLAFTLLAVPAGARAQPPAHGFTALTDMAGATYLGSSGGLYPDGRNDMPTEHFTAGLLAAVRIERLDLHGRPSPAGRIVLLSIGMSNTTQEFCNGGRGRCAPGTFVDQATSDPAVDRGFLALVDGARGGRSAEFWDDPLDPDYDAVRDERLAPLGLSEAQVQVAWVKVAHPRPATPLPSPAADAYALEAAMGRIARALRVRYPNLRQVFLSSRIYAGYATSTLNPEPYAYESGLAVKWVVEAQIRQMQSPRGAVVDPIAGDLAHDRVAPWIAWGPYLWADGLNPRSDGLVWERGDFAADGTHPSAAGARKVGALLLEFFKTSPHTGCWFLAGRSCP